MLSRRNFLSLATLAAGGAAATGCRVPHAAAQRVLTSGDGETAPPTRVPLQTAPTSSASTPETASATSSPNQIILRTLNRGGYGPRLGDVERVAAMGLSAYLEQQLHPEQIDDGDIEQFVADLAAYHRPLNNIDLMDRDQRVASVQALYGATLGRALHSKRQLYEVMVEFWSDHFHVYIGKNGVMPFLKVVDDRDHIRPNALTNFRTLLHASATSPAMQLYLDNAQNRVGAPNENYARELLELHTLGINGGYTEADVKETARVLTGWTFVRRGTNRGEIRFISRNHDFQQKTVLGTTFPSGQGEAELDRLIDLLANHPATAQHIATKLVRRFVADQPPAALVSRVAQEFTATGGDVKQMLRVIFLSDEFANAPTKLKRPYTYFVSTLRILDAEAGQNARLGQLLERLGQVPFQWPAPNGYPDVSAAWSNNLLPRWNLPLALAQNQLRGITVNWAAVEKQLPDRSNAINQLAQHLLHQAVDSAAHQQYADFFQANGAGAEAVRAVAALMLASPAFQEA